MQASLYLGKKDEEKLAQEIIYLPTGRGVRALCIENEYNLQRDGAGLNL